MREVVPTFYKDFPKGGRYYIRSFWKRYHF